MDYESPTSERLLWVAISTGRCNTNDCNGDGAEMFVHNANHRKLKYLLIAAWLVRFPNRA